MTEHGVTHVAAEVSSHALALHRVAGCEFDAAVLSNVSHDHFDFHGSYDRYLEAKTTLFTGSCDGALPPPRLAVLNADDPSFEYVGARARGDAVTYALNAAADVRAQDVKLDPDGSSFTVHAGRRTARVDLRLPGRFNVSNALAALATAWA